MYIDQKLTFHLSLCVCRQATKSEGEGKPVGGGGGGGGGEGGGGGGGGSRTSSTSSDDSVETIPKSQR